MRMKTIKCVIVGDGVCGKTSLLLTYMTGEFPDCYLPVSPLDNWSTYSVIVEVDGKPYTLSLSDTAGQDEYDRLRTLCYPQTDVILICFSIVSSASYRNAEVKWVPEVKFHCPDIPIILIGTKHDLRDDVEAEPFRRRISYVEGLKLHRKIKAVKYLECSSKTKEGVKDVFDEVIRTALLIGAGKR